jgi:hypothetical protein
MGSTIWVVAVFEVNSVRNVKLMHIAAIMTMGWIPDKTYILLPMRVDSPVI